jgi:KaiC/GvpD/RAD55 family RecA-like ATPase
MTISQRNDDDAPRRLLPIELGTLLELDLPKPRAVCGGLLRDGSLAMVYGPAGTGKTFFMMGLAVAVAYRDSFLGFDVPAEREVLYLDGEMAVFEMQARAHQLAHRIRESIDHHYAPLRIVTPDLATRGIPKIDTIEGRDAVLAYAESAPNLGLVILDNLSCLTDPEDDNSSASWSAVQDLLLALRRRGIATVVGHHAGKGGQQRGTSRRADILDLVVKLSPASDAIEDGRTRVTVEFEKARGLPPEQKAPFTATLEAHPDGGLMWTRSKAAVPVHDRVRSMLLDGMPPADVAAELKTARSYVYRLRTELIEAGELSKGSKSRGQTANAAAVVPLSPSLRRGQGTGGIHGTRDRYGDN